MKTYTTSRDLFGNLTGNRAPVNLTLGDELINDATKTLINKYPWYFRDAFFEETTVASQEEYVLDVRVGKISSVFVTVGGTKYQLTEVISKRDWDVLTDTVVTSDTATHFFATTNSVLIHPLPTASGNDITVNYKKKVKDLTLPDHTTGTVASITTATTEVKGTATAWTSKMVGCYIRISNSMADNTGDGEWYEIAEVTDATTIVLQTPYIGQAITAGTADYTIGEVSILPEDYQRLPILSAVMEYFVSVKPSSSKAQSFRALYKDSFDEMMQAYGSKTSSLVLSEEITQQNPNNIISSI